jgi:hypothetical protein
MGQGTFFYILEAGGKSNATHDFFFKTKAHHSSEVVYAKKKV